jgi:hypothetical protein
MKQPTLFALRPCRYCGHPRADWLSTCQSSVCRALWNEGLR